MQILNANKKHFIRNKLIKSAPSYKRLLGIDYLIITEDGQKYVVNFKAKDFNHLSGIKTDLTKSFFFYNCLTRKININNINTN